MRSQIPELLKSNIGDINDVVGLRDWSSWEVAVGENGAEWHDEAGEVFVEREEAEEFWCGLAVGFGFRFGIFCVLLICRHSLAVQVCDLEDVDWDAATVATAGPLWVL